MHCLLPSCFLRFENFSFCSKTKGCIKICKQFAADGRRARRGGWLGGADCIIETLHMVWQQQGQKEVKKVAEKSSRGETEKKEKGEIEIIETHGAAAEEDGKVGTCKYRKRRN